MRKTKKILAGALAMVMLFSMSMTASAATITIEDGETEGSAYSAYRLLDAKVKTDDVDGPVYLYSLNEKYSDAVISATGHTTAKDIVEYLGGLDAGEIRSFADSVYMDIKVQNAEYTSTSNQFADVEPGYYLIVETQIGDDTYSLVMLDTVGEENITINTKESVPELVKKVQEKNDTEGTETDWQDGADYDIGDAVPFKLTGTVAEQYDSYLTYYYAFHDTLSAGFTFDPDSVIVKVDETIITEGYEVITADLEDDCSFEIRFEDLKTVDTVTKDSVITVEYSALLTEDAVIGPDGNPNVAKLEYCNNPYAAGTGEEDGTDDGDGAGEEKSTSETPEDKVIVFTYELDIHKVDVDGAPLEGAGFTLYKLTAADDSQTGNSQTDDVQTEDEAAAVSQEYEAVGEEITGVTTFLFKGLDAGQYKLVETTVPLGFTRAEDVVFTVAADYETDAADPKFGELTVEQILEDSAQQGDAADLENTTEQEEADVFTEADGIISTDVVNVTGLLLPSTGGVGKIVFYIAGAVIMIVGVILFIRSRRMEENK